MNLQERDQLNGFLQQLVNVSLPQKDEEADALIRAACAKQPIAPAAPAAPAWGSSMLGTVATTAAGVVAGSFLFQGIQGLMGHHNQAPNAATNPPPPAANKLAANTEDSTDLQNDSNYFADAGSADFGSGDVT